MVDIPEFSFQNGELIKVVHPRGTGLYKVFPDQEGEPLRHRVNMRTGEVSPKGCKLKITDRIRRIHNAN